MGIPGILKEIGKGERVALAKLAVEHLEKTQRPLRIAIDAAIWNFQSQSGQGGKNPALRTLYYRLLRILALPIHPLFVYDGKNKPLVKRGRTVSRWGTCIANETSKKLVQQFKYPYHVAPGEAEAECAFLQQRGIVDMVMSQDGDAIMFGSRLTLRDWSKEGSRGNKTPTHVNLLDLPRLKERSGLDPDGMVLVALLSGGDYDQDGVPGFGAGLACEVARAGFGTDLIQLIRNEDETGLKEWRDRLQYELETNESGYFKRRHKTLKIPESFPDKTLVGYYIHPSVSTEEDLSKLERKLANTWDEDINIPELRRYVGNTFDWLYKPGAWKFVRGLAPSLLAHRLRRGQGKHSLSSVEQIREKRQHFTSDGIPELRVEVIPADVVGLDLDAEEDSPEYLAGLCEEQEQDVDANDAASEQDNAEEAQEPLSSQRAPKTRKSPPWDPKSPEKMWIPETIVQLGIPALVELWQENEREKLSDPKKFATRKCKRPAAKVAEAPGSSRIDQYFVTSKPISTQASDRPAETDLKVAEAADVVAPTPYRVPRTPIKRVPNPKVIPKSPDIKDFFRVSRAGVQQALPEKTSRSERPHVEYVQALHINSSTSTPRVTRLQKETPLPRGKSSRESEAPENAATATASSFAVDLDPDQVRRDHRTPPKGHATEELSELPETVTRRKNRSGKLKVAPILLQDSSSPPQSRSLKHFSHAAQGTEVNPSSKVLDNGPSSDHTLPPNPSTGLYAGFVPEKIYPVTRDSLPGTWKDIDFDEDIISVKTKRSTRVSYVDLTGK